MNAGHEDGKAVALSGRERSRSKTDRKDGLLERRARRRISTTSIPNPLDIASPVNNTKASNRERAETVRQKVDPETLLENEQRALLERREEGTMNRAGGSSEVDLAKADARRLGRMAQAMGIVIPTLQGGSGGVYQLASHSGSPTRSGFHPRIQLPRSVSAPYTNGARHDPPSPSASGPSSRPMLPSQSSSKSLLSPLSSPLHPPYTSGTVSLPNRRTGSALSSRSARSQRSTVSRVPHHANFLIKVVPPAHMFVPPPALHATDGMDSINGYGYGLITPAASTENGHGGKATGMLSSPSFGSARSASTHPVDRWKKGKILPLKPNLDGMIKLIVEEWGLPSGIGVVVFLQSLASDDGRRDRLDGSDDEVDAENSEEALPENDLIGSEVGRDAWKIFWSSYYATAKKEAQMATLVGGGGRKAIRLLPRRRRSVERESGESLKLGTLAPETEMLYTPIKDGVSGFLTPASTQLSFQSQLSGASPSSSSIAPSASASQTHSPSKFSPLSARGQNGKAKMPQSVLGTIEFDVDLSKAGSEWYRAWMKRRRETAGLRDRREASNGPVKEGTGRPRLRELKLNPGTSAFITGEYQVLDDEDAGADTSSMEAGVDPKQGFGSDEDDLMSLVDRRRPGQTQDLGIRDIGTQRVLDGELSLEHVVGRPEGPGAIPQDVAEIAAMLGLQPEQLDPYSGKVSKGGLTVNPGRLHRGLASPIDLPSPHSASLPAPGKQMHLLHAAAFGPMPPGLMPAADGAEMVGLGVGLTPNHMRESGAWQGDARQSTMIMRDKLDDLEKVLKALSPRHLRFSTLPAPGSELMRNRERFEAGPAEDTGIARPPRASSKGVVVPRGEVLTATEDLNTPSASSVPDFDSPINRSEAIWPAVPFIKTPENTPLLPQEVTFIRSYDGQKLTPRSAPEGTAPIPLSPETMMRMEYDAGGLMPGMAAGKKPLRPARPPSPLLDVYVAPSPPLKLGGLTHLTSGGMGATEPAMPGDPQVPAEGLSEITRKVDGPPAGKTIKKQKSVGRLNQLFQRKVNEGGSYALPLKVAPGPPLPLIRPLDITSPTSPMGSEDFGAVISPGDNKNATFPPKSPKTGGFGRRLLGGLHARGMSSGDKKEMEEVLALQKKALGLMSPERGRPPVPALPQRQISATPIQHPSLQRIASLTTSPTIPSERDTTPPQSPRTPGARNPTSPTTATSPSPIRRKPVPRASGDDTLPTSVSSGSLTFGGMGGMGRSESGRSIPSLAYGRGR